ncbi:hypothetical protein [Paenisporosarcina sp. TG20]|uniref:hypothetical protein n=1 Tax=Paenisporosarcina sp. TG20 TaxID=1211706 RepID=UPI0003078A76|nr:hypothetical protein [Paenisporosarcina sp. TG20]
MKMMIVLLAVFSNVLFQPTSPSNLNDQVTPVSEVLGVFWDPQVVVQNNVENKEVPAFEEVLLEIGYKEVNIALQESTEHFKRSIALPTELPPVIFTHSFGRFKHSYGKENEQFEISYLNEHFDQNHYQIRIKPVKYKIEISEKKISQVIKLSDGSEAIYSTNFPLLDLLAFEEDEWQYILLVDKRISKTVTKEILVNIANTIK